MEENKIVFNTLRKAGMTNGLEFADNGHGRRKP